MNNAIYYPGGKQEFQGAPSRKVWYQARRLSITLGRCQVCTHTKVVQYSNGKRVK